MKLPYIIESVLKPAILTTLLGFSGVSSAATFTTLTLPELTSDLTTWSDGGKYTALFPSSRDMAGVPFQFASNAEGNNVFAGDGDVVIADVGQTIIPADVFGATHVFTLINTAWGVSSAEVGSITFKGSAGAEYTVMLVEGFNVRDHYVGSYVNTTTAPYVTQNVWGASWGAHLDMQDFVLPSEFATQTLTDIVFDSTGGRAYGSPFIAAATVATGVFVPSVPEPEVYSALLVGLAVLTVRMRRREQA